MSKNPTAITGELVDYDERADAIIVDRDSYDYYAALFVRNGRTPPTPRQFKFAEYYMKHNDVKAAYYYADYRNIDHLTASGQRYKLRKASVSVGVQTLFKLMTNEWMRRQDVNVNSLCTRALQSYNNADNMKDQLNAIRLMANLSGMYRN